MVEALVVLLRQWSRRLQHQADAAREVVNTRLGVSSWSGLAADSFTDRLRALAAAASLAAARHDSGVVAATRWSASMELFQADADRALFDAEEALAELESAQESVAALGVEHAALLSALRALERAYNSREKPAPGSSAPAHVEVTTAREREQDVEADLARARFAVEDAQERLEDAKRRAVRAKDEYDQAEKAFATALGEAMEGAIDPVPAPALAAYASAVGKLSLISATASVNASLMDTLTRLTPEELAALIAENPELIQQFWKHPPAPGKVAAWWSGLSAQVRSAMQYAAPELLGNLAGLPFAVRHRCNIVVYEDVLLRKSSLSPEQQKMLTALENVLGDQLASLVCFTLDAPVPMAAVGYGDLDAADTVTWAAPGMLSDAADATEGWSRAAKSLYTQQRRADSLRTHAVVGWLGYDTPDLLSVNTPASAQDGSWRFANELDGTHAARSVSGGMAFPYVSVVAHSYGTTMAADALTRTAYAVDSFTMLGSAGIDTQVVKSLADLHVNQADGRPAIYTTSAKQDFVAPFGSSFGGRANPNPEAMLNAGTGLSMPFKGVLNPPRSMAGAQSFSSEGTVLPSGEVLHQTKVHDVLNDEGSGYLDEKTEALYNTGMTTIGQPENVAGGLRPNR